MHFIYPCMYTVKTYMGTTIGIQKGYKLKKNGEYSANLKLCTTLT